MKGIIQQAIGLHLPTGLAARLSQSLKKALAIAVIRKEGFASIPAIHHMINRSGILDSKLSGHSRKLSPPTNMSIPLTDPEAIRIWRAIVVGFCPSANACQAGIPLFTA